jgi:hypothetical protein
LSDHLSGVGPAKAKDIVEFRSKNGNFSSKYLQELAGIKRVKDDIIRKIEACTFKKALPGSVSAPSAPPRAPKAKSVDAGVSPAGVDNLPTTPSSPAKFDYTTETLTEAQVEQVVKRTEIFEHWKANKEVIIQEWRQDPIKLGGKEVVLKPPLDKMYNDIVQEYDRCFQELMEDEQDDFDEMIGKAGELNAEAVNKHKRGRSRNSQQLGHPIQSSWQLKRLLISWQVLPRSMTVSSHQVRQSKISWVISTLRYD